MCLCISPFTNQFANKMWLFLSAAYKKGGEEGGTEESQPAERSFSMVWPHLAPVSSRPPPPPNAQFALIGQLSHTWASIAINSLEHHVL